MCTLSGYLSPAEYTYDLGYRVGSCQIGVEGKEALFKRSLTAICDHKNLAYIGWFISLLTTILIQEMSDWMLFPPR